MTLRRPSLAITIGFGLHTLTPRERARKRYGRVALTAVTAAAARGSSVLALLVATPIAIDHLGVERFGVWMTLSSIAALVGLADLGLGNGLITAIAQADGRQDRELMRRYVSSAFFFLGGLTLVFAAVFAAGYRFVPWERILNVSSPAVRVEAGATVAVFVLCTLANVPLGLVNRVQAGCQAGFVSNAWTVFGNVAGLIGFLVGVGASASLPWLLFAFVGGPTLALVLNSIVFFSSRQRAWLRPSVGAMSWETGRALLAIGALFLVLQAAGAVAYQSDTLIIAQVLGASEVTHFAVPMRLFMLAPLVLSLVLTPLWPAYAEAATRGDRAWIERTFRLSVVLALAISVPLALILVGFGPAAVRLWVGGSVAPTLPLLLGLGVWSVVMSVAGTTAMLLNGLGALRFQAICAGAMALANVPLSVALALAVGVSGPVWGSVVAQVLFVFVPTLFMLRRLRNARSAWRPPVRPTTETAISPLR